MADITASVASWSTTEASNAPSGGTTVGTGLDDNLRAVQAGVRKEYAQSSDLSAASTIDLSTATGSYVEVTTTGTVSITSLGTVAAGISRTLRFKSVGTSLTLTHNATSLILPGAANIVVQTGDRASFKSLGSGNWLCEWYTRATGVPTVGVALPAEQNLSGSSVDFTSIPSGVRQITVTFEGLSTNGTNLPGVQIGDSGGVETSGYAGACTLLANTATANSAALAGTSFALSPAWGATAVIHGRMTLTLKDAANFTWVASWVVGETTSGQTMLGAGSKSLTAELDRVRIVTADTFDAGSVSIAYV